jgi:hypothetical protein
MIYNISDLTPFFSDHCWMYVILARDAKAAVILRRGPTQWWRLTLWDTRRDTFEPGQWFRGRIYPAKCDLSPDGKLFLYFGGKFTSRSVDAGYSDTYTAISRPPYLTALALWPIGGTYGGGGYFVDNRTVYVGADLPHHPKHPPGPLRLTSAYSRPINEFPKRSGDLILSRDLAGDCPSRTPTLYTLSAASGQLLALFEAHWADWDQRGRLVAAAGGRVLAGRLTRKRELVWRQLISTHEDRPSRMEAPEWARRW